MAIPWIIGGDCHGLRPRNDSGIWRLSLLCQIDSGSFVEVFSGFFGGQPVFRPVAAPCGNEGGFKQVFVDDDGAKIGDRLFVIVLYGAFLFFQPFGMFDEVFRISQITG